MLEIFLGILAVAIPFICIFGYYKIKENRKKSNIEEKNHYLQSIDKDIKLSKWNFNEYIVGISDKKFLQAIDNEGSHYVEIDNSHISSSYDYAYLYFSEIKSVKATHSFDLHNFTDCLQLEVSMKSRMSSVYGEEPEDEIKKITFGANYLDNAEKIYRIILNIIAINKKLKEARVNEILTSESEVLEFENLINTIKEKSDKVKEYIEQYKKDIFVLIESSSKDIFRISLWSALGKNKFSKAGVAKDGFHPDTYETADEEIRKFISFSKGLKDRIKNSWSDNKTLDLVVYIIIRNTIISYFAKMYRLNYNFKTIEEFCNALLSVDETALSSQIMMYIYNYVFETNISLPLWDTYRKIENEIYTRLKELELQHKENALFLYSEDNIEDEIKEDINNSNLPMAENSLDFIDKMTGEEFEKFIGDYFRKIGYNTLVTPLSGDFGVDIIVENELVKIGIQAKRYSDRVTNAAVQEIVAGIKHYNLDKGMVITNNYFSRSAIALAKDNNIVLWDRDTIKVKFSKN